MKKNRSTTIKDLAHKLDISTSTVSRALRNQPDVNPETKQKVHELAKRLNYEPNALAISLVNKRSLTVGVVVPGYNAYFYGEAISGIQEYALEHGYHINICHTRESYELEKAVIKKLVSKRVDGILLSLSRETRNYDHLTELSAKNVPLVLFNRGSEHLDCSQVAVNDYDGAFKAVTHLVQQGYRRIAHVRGPEGVMISDNRKKGYVDALNKFNLPVRNEWIVTSNFSLDSGIRATEQLMSEKEKPDAIFCICDEVAYGVIATLKKKGYAVPREVGVVGFTGEPFASIIEPPLTTIHQPAYEVGAKAAELLISQIADPSLPSKNLKLGTHLIERESSVKNLRN